MPDRPERWPSQTAPLKCDLAPSELAAWVLQEAAMDPPITELREIVSLLGIGQVEESRSITKAGCLDLKNGELVIRVRPGRRQWQRFTLAHELGHYLLAVHQGIPLTEQTNDRRVERYCNAFASHLLLPRSWLREETLDDPISLSVLLRVANEAGCTAATALVGLNDGLKWGSTLAVWRNSGRWTVQTCIRPYPSVRLERADGTDRVLNSIPRGTTTKANLPVLANRRPVVLDAELRRFGPTVLAFTESVGGIDVRTSSTS